MPVNEDLLEILCCPLTKVPVRPLPPEALNKINQQIAEGQVKYHSGNVVESPLEEALITADHRRLYMVRDSIPIMLIDESIPTEQLPAGCLP